MCKSNTQTAVGNDFRQREIWGFDVKVALDDLDIGGNASEEFVRLLVGKVTETEDLTNLAGREELAELEEMLGFGRGKLGTGGELLWRVCPKPCGLV